MGLSSSLRSPLSNASISHQNVLTVPTKIQKSRPVVSRAERNFNFERLAVVGPSIALARDQKRDSVPNFHGHPSIDFALAFGGVCDCESDFLFLFRGRYKI